MKIEILTAMIVIALVFGTGQAKAPAAEHDRHQAMLVAFLPHPMDGRVSVKNWDRSCGSKQTDAGLPA